MVQVFSCTSLVSPWILSSLGWVVAGLRTHISPLLSLAIVTASFSSPGLCDNSSDHTLLLFAPGSEQTSLYLDLTYKENIMCFRLSSLSFSFSFFLIFFFWDRAHYTAQASIKQMANPISASQALGSEVWDTATSCFLLSNESETGVANRPQQTVNRESRAPSIPCHAWSSKVSNWRGR